jgi:hypothetical protein
MDMAVKRPKSEETTETASHIPVPITVTRRNPAFASIDAGRERRSQLAQIQAGHPSDATSHTSQASRVSGSSNDTTTPARGRHTRPTHGSHGEHLATSPLPPTKSTSPGDWEKVESETPASTDDEGDFARALQTMQEGFEAGIWVRYGVLSSRRQAELIRTANKNIQTIVDVSKQGLTENEYFEVYSAVLDSLARAYCTWKKSSWPNTPEPKSEPKTSPTPKSEPEPANIRTRDVPLHMVVNDPVVSFAMDQMNAPRQSGEPLDDFNRRRAAIQRANEASTTPAPPEGSSSYETNPTVAARCPSGGEGRTLSENVLIAELYPSPNQIPLLDRWEDRVGFQRLRDAALAETGYSRIEDQGVWFVSHRPVGHVYHFTSAAGGGHEPGGSDGSSNDDDDDRRNNNNPDPRPPNEPPRNPRTPMGNGGYGPPPSLPGGRGNGGGRGGGGGGDRGPPGHRGGDSPPPGNNRGSSHGFSMPAPAPPRGSTHGVHEAAENHRNAMHERLYELI